jgi:hypothetical protein
MSATGENGSRSFLRYSGLAQAGRVSGFEQCADLRHPVVSDSPQAGNARITIVAASPALIVAGQRAKRPSSFYSGPQPVLRPIPPQRAPPQRNRIGKTLM